MMDENRKNRLEALRMESIKYIREVQMKYIYYVIALNVASVAFTMSQVKDQQFNWTHFILYTAVLVWALGVFNGFIFLDKFKLVLHHWQNYAQYELGSTKKSREENASMLDKFNEITIQVQQTADSKYKLSLLCFYIGCICYLIWHSAQMIWINGNA